MARLFQVGCFNALSDRETRDIFLTIGRCIWVFIGRGVRVWRLDRGESTLWNDRLPKAMVDGVKQDHLITPRATNEYASFDTRDDARDRYRAQGF